MRSGHGSQTRVIRPQLCRMGFVVKRTVPRGSSLLIGLDRTIRSKFQN